MTDEKFLMESRQFVLKHQLPVTRVKEYWIGLENGKILGTVCKNCGSRFYPPQADCSNCYSSDMEWVEISGEGEIECFTQLHSFPQGFEFVGKPYTIAVAKFGDFRVIGWYRGEEIPEVGQKVVAETDKDETGVWKVYFRKV